MNNKEQILCFGEVLWDNLPTGPLAGGAPMNVALHLKRFGIKSVIASSVGNDPKGKKMLDFLADAGMDTQFIQIHPTLPTSEVLVHLDEKNVASYEICAPVAWDEINLTPELNEELKSSKVIVYGSLASRDSVSRETLSYLLESDLLKIMDVNLRPPFNTKDIVVSLMEKAHIVKLNDEELISIAKWYNLVGDFTQLCLGLYKLLKLQVLIVTRGENGACLIHDNIMYRHEGFKVDVADSVGAGDAFLAGFLAAYFDGKDMNTALSEASAIGAFVASQPGATPYYTKDVIEKIIRPV